MKITNFILLIFLAVATNVLSIGPLESWLIPIPREVTLENGSLKHRNGRIICNEVSDPKVFDIVKSIQDIFNKTGHSYSIAAVNAKDEVPFVSLKLVTDGSIKPQGYKLSINENSVIILAADKPGLFYGAQTLKQIAGYATETGKFPLVSISDWPDFERRGVMIDVNKDQVPTMETFYGIIDKLAEWKINEFQVFFKYAFEFINHPEVSQDYSPFTAEQIIDLDQYCKKRFIDLVPYHDGFGKLSYWMKYDKYLHLAECPEGCQTEWGKYGPSSLSPAVPEALELVDEIYSELLPNYSSKYVNIGSDETVELGLGRSKEMCEKYGVGKVYLDFLKEVKKRASKNGNRVQFWGDIILKHPELIPELPKDMIALVWGYEANHPFERDCPKFKNSGLDFYVCPGTSSWNSILGRTNNAIANLQHAAEQGLKYKAMGYLNTNWGETGNWHPLSVCYPGYLYGAAVSWYVSGNKNINVSSLLDRWVFNDKSGKIGRIIMDLGNAHELTEVRLSNNSIFNRALTTLELPYKNDKYFSKLKLSAIEKVDSSLQINISKILEANMECQDAKQVSDELILAAELCRHSCKIMKNKMLSKDGTLNNITESEKQFLIRDISRIIAKHRDIWMVRNRVGGLEDSTDKLQRILLFYNNL